MYNIKIQTANVCIFYPIQFVFLIFNSADLIMQALFDVIVVGAGYSGLATRYCLRAPGLDHALNCQYA
jgi:hypothetical protein